MVQCQRQRRETPRPRSLRAAAAAAALLQAARPAQWVKNLVLPLPFLFGGALGAARGWALAAAGFAVFCVITSGVYIVNDIMDRERDRAHPRKDTGRSPRDGSPCRPAAASRDVSRPPASRRPSRCGASSACGAWPTRD